MDAKLLQLVDSIPGFLSPPEIEFLYHRARMVKQGHSIVEIGSYRGRSTVALALGAPSGVRVYAIDSHIYGDPTREDSGPERQAEFYDNVLNTGVGHRVAAVTLRSVEAAAAWRIRKEPVGLLFVDGCHLYDSIRQDLDAWLPLTAPGADIILHDYIISVDHPGVEKAANETPGLQLIGTCETIGHFNYR